MRAVAPESVQVKTGSRLCSRMITSRNLVGSLIVVRPQVALAYEAGRVGLLPDYSERKP